MSSIANRIVLRAKHSEPGNTQRFAPVFILRWFAIVAVHFTVDRPAELLRLPNNFANSVWEAFAFYAVERYQCNREFSSVGFASRFEINILRQTPERLNCFSINRYWFQTQQRHQRRNYGDYSAPGKLVSASDSVC